MIMSIEYELPYTAEEIDEKLGQIDDILQLTEVLDTKLDENIAKIEDVLSDVKDITSGFTFKEVQW